MGCCLSSPPSDTATLRGHGTMARRCGGTIAEAASQSRSRSRRVFCRQRVNFLGPIGVKYSDSFL